MNTERKAQFGEIVMQGAVFIVLVVIAIMLLVLIKAANREEKILIERVPRFDKLERQHEEILKRCGG